MDVADSEDPEGLRVLYYLVQDLKVCRALLEDVYATDAIVRIVLDLLTHLPPFQDQADLKVQVPMCTDASVFTPVAFLPSVYMYSVVLNE